MPYVEAYTVSSQSSLVSRLDESQSVLLPVPLSALYSHWVHFPTSVERSLYLPVDIRLNTSPGQLMISASQQRGKQIFLPKAPCLAPKTPPRQELLPYREDSDTRVQKPCGILMAKDASAA
jgi:hypothetical protein